MQVLYNLRQPWPNASFLAISRTGDFLILLPVAAMCIYLWRRSEKMIALIYLAGVCAFPLLAMAIKSEFARPRQALFPPLVVEQTYSFPSGHALTAVAVYGFAAILLWQRGQRLLAVIAGI